MNKKRLSIRQLYARLEAKLLEVEELKQRLEASVTDAEAIHKQINLIKPGQDKVE